MKKLLLIVILTLAAANLVIGQKGEMVPKPPKKVSTVVERKNVFLQDRGIASIDLPDNLAEKHIESHPNKHDDVSWNDCSVSWERNPKKAGPKILEVKVSVTGCPVRQESSGPQPRTRDTGKVPADRRNGRRTK
jgi:hypothetical protein